MFYDSNDVQLSTKVNEVTCEDTAAKYRAWGWNVLEVDGCDPVAMAGALEVAHAETQRPTLIIGHTVMARKAVMADGTSMEGFVSTHGQPLSAAGADIALTVKNLGGDPENPWVIFDDVKKLYADRREELCRIAAERHKAEAEWAEKNPELNAKLQSWINKELPALDWSKIEYKANLATRAASATVLGYLAQHVENMIVSSADLANSDKTDGFLKKTKALMRGDFYGAFLQSGVAELTMACLMNGIALHGGLIGACGTFFVFSDYMKPAIRISALMEQPVKYIFTHDAFRVGEDGPTHEPIEQESQIRLLELMNNLSGKRAALVLRPADSAETVEAYRVAMNTWDRPSVLIFSRQNLEDLPALGASRAEDAKGLEKGAYLVRKADAPVVTLVGNGSEVSLLLHAAEALAAEGMDANVVSVPSVGLFLDQDKAYRDSVIIPGVKTFAVSSGLPSVFDAILPAEAGKFGLARFGASAPAKVLDEKFGFTTANIVERVKQFLS